MFEMRLNYKEMPKDTIEVEGMQVIHGNTTVPHVRMLEDFEYAEKDGYALHIRMMVPELMDIKRKYPLYIHVQGSAWYEQNLNEHVVDLAPVCKAGYVIAIVQYRPSTVRIFPAQVEDVKTAVRYLEEHQEEYPIDMDNLYIGGDSSGGHVAMLCYATWNKVYLDQECTWLPAVRAFLDFYGPIDLLREVDQVSGIDRSGAYDYPEADLLGVSDLKKIPEKVFETNPSYYMEEGEYPPVLIMHGNKDRFVPFRQSVEWFISLKESGHNAVFYQIDDADHGGSCFWCRETTDTVIRFMNTYHKETGVR